MVALNILAKNQNFKNLRNKRPMITKALTSSYHWKILVLFLLAKENTWKSIFNTNSELLPNRTEKQTMLFKTILNCLFNDIWCYLVIGSFDWKTGIFPQTVVKGLLYP